MRSDASRSQHWDLTGHLDGNNMQAFEKEVAGRLKASGADTEYAAIALNAAACKGNLKAVTFF
jgi:hypothetical protein